MEKCVSKKIIVCCPDSRELKDLKVKISKDNETALTGIGAAHKVSHQSLPPQPEGSKKRDIVVYVLNQTDLDRINDISDMRYTRAVTLPAESGSRGLSLRTWAS